MFLLLIIVITTSSFIFLCFKLNPTSSKSTVSSLALIKNSHRILDWLTDILKSSPTRTVSTPIGIVTADPIVVEHFLKTRFDNYPKGEKFLLPLRDLLGNGIFNSDGDLWKSQRKTASPEFSTNTIRSFMMSNVIMDMSNRLIPFLSAASAENRTFDMQEVFFRLAFDNVCKVVFSWDPASLDEDSVEGREFNDTFEEACELTMYRFRDVHPLIWKAKRLLRIGSERRLREKIDYVHGFVMEVIQNLIGY